MKNLVLSIVLVSGVAFAQNPNRSSLAPILAVSRYVINDEATTGPTLGLRYQSREFSSSRFSVFGGVTLSPNGVSYYESAPFLYYDHSQPYRLQPPIYGGAHRYSQFAFGLAFFGFDWRVYLADGSVRPYVGVGAQMVSWSYTNTFTGTLTPDAKAGCDIRLTSGFTGFVEAQYSFGMPTLYGSRASSLRDITMFAIGVSFAPQF